MIPQFMDGTAAVVSKVKHEFPSRAYCGTPGKPLSNTVKATNDAVDSEILIVEQIGQVGSKTIPLVVTSDSKFLDQVARTTSGLQDKKLRIALAELREGW